MCSSNPEGSPWNFAFQLWKEEKNLHAKRGITYKIFLRRFQIRMAFANLILRFSRPCSFPIMIERVKSEAQFAISYSFPNGTAKNWGGGKCQDDDQIHILCQIKNRRVLGRSRSFSTISNTIRTNVLLSDDVD